MTSESSGSGLAWCKWLTTSEFRVHDSLPSFVKIANPRKILPSTNSQQEAKKAHPDNPRPENYPVKSIPKMVLLSVSISSRRLSRGSDVGYNIAYTLNHQLTRQLDIARLTLLFNSKTQHISTVI